MLDANQKRRANAMPVMTPIADIAAHVGASFEEVVVYLFGGADFTPPAPKDKPSRHYQELARQIRHAEPAPPIEDEAELQRRREAIARQDAELEAVHDELTQEEDHGSVVADTALPDGAPPPHAAAATAAPAAAVAVAEDHRDIPARAPAAPHARLDAEPPAAGGLYYLTRGDGYYLHESLEQLTTNRKFAWKGNARQMEGVFKAKPAWRALDPERVPG